MLKRLIGCAGLLFVSAFLVAPQMTVTHAESLQSSHYIIDESAVGTDDTADSASASYQANSATSALAVGNTASGGWQIDTGTKTTPDPALSFAVTNSDVNFGSFSATTATVTTATFSVSNYTSYGYVVQIIGTPPSNGSHTISAMATTGTSQTGIEQFGINLVANTSPSSVGANPNNGQFGFGVADANYGTANNYRYVSGETIASAPKSSGLTTYTISYLVNVGGLTPGGLYTSNQTIIITGTY